MILTFRYQSLIQFATGVGQLRLQLVKRRMVMAPTTHHFQLSILPFVTRKH